MARSSSSEEARVGLLTSDPSAATEPEASSKTPLYSFYVLAVLTVIYYMNQIDRLVLPFVKSNIQVDVHMDESEYGLLFGSAFSVVFVAMGVIIGPLADKYNRKYLLLSGLALWSAMTFATGYATQFWHLVLARIGLGIGQAVCNPTAFSIISDYFPPEKRALANSVYTMGIYFGGGSAAILGGGLSDSSFGWRNTLKVFGYVGFAVVVLAFFTVREPIRGRFKKSADKEKRKSKVTNYGGADDEEKNEPDAGESQARSFTVKETLMYMMGLASIWKFFLAAGIRSMGGYAFGGFVPSYMQASFAKTAKHNIEHGKSSVYIWTMYGLITLIFGCSASYLGGFISKHWQKKNKRAPAFVAAIGAVVATPFVIGIMFATRISHDLNTAFAIGFTSLALEYLTAEVWGGPASAIVSNLLPPGMQGTGFAVYGAIATLIGASGPEILGLALENASKNPDGTPTNTRTYITAFIIVGAYLLSAFGFITAVATMGKDQRIKDQVEETGIIPEVSAARKGCFVFGLFVLGAGMIVLAILSLV